jgi:hypothetical protein
MPMKSKCAARITPHCPHMVRRFGDHLFLSRGISHSSILFHSTFNVGRSVFDVHCPKEWWTPIRHAHEKPMGGENHFSLPPHGQAIRRSPLLVKRPLTLFKLSVLFCSPRVKKSFIKDSSSKSSQSNTLQILKFALTPAIDSFSLQLC